MARSVVWSKKFFHQVFANFDHVTKSIRLENASYFTFLTHQLQIFLLYTTCTEAWRSRKSKMYVVSKRHEKLRWSEICYTERKTQKKRIPDWYRPPIHHFPRSFYHKQKPITNNFDCRVDDDFILNWMSNCIYCTYSIYTVHIRGIHTNSTKEGA